MAQFECTEHMENFLRELPKCEHHVHLEGTLEPSLLFKLAQRNNITLPESFPKTVEECNDRYNRFADLQDFLDHYYIGMSVLITEDDFTIWLWIISPKLMRMDVIIQKFSLIHKVMSRETLILMLSFKVSIVLVKIQILNLEPPTS